jgi:hypothetical protein
MPGPSLNRVRAAPFRANRHYFRRPTWVGAWKLRLALLALLLTAGWVTARMILIPRQLDYAICTHGELIRAHAPWANQCDACHAPHDPASGNGGLFAARERWRSFRCDTCHPGPAADPKNYAPHYDRTAKPHLADDATARDCSNCHHDHRGADFNLTRIADSDCTRCHKDLSPLHGTAPSVTAFHKDHPEFRAVGKPPARGLKFNHALHLATGLTEKGNLDNSNATFQLGQVDPAYREQYKRFADSDNLHAALRLDCSACHEPAGGGYKPVVFETHCQGCHAQTVSSLQSPKGVTTKPFTVPHGRPASETDRLIRAELLRQIDEQKGFLRSVPLPPSDRLDQPRTVVPSDLGKEADALAKLATGLLTCQKCHEVKEGIVQATGTPALWLPAARFDHTAHRAVKCAECHNTWDQAAVVRGAPPEPLNVPGIDNCRRCHAPQTVVNGSPQGGARYDCIACHRYHMTGREPPADRRLPVDSFLRGTRHP